MLHNAMPLVKNRAMLLQRMQISFQILQNQPQVNSNCIGTVGFCLGGMAALDLARSGVDIKATISVHGILAAVEPNKKISGSILALHGYDDPQVLQEQVSSFTAEMQENHADWQLHIFGNTKHAFTDPKAGEIGLPEMGREYNELSTVRSWSIIKLFLDETLANN